MNLLMKYCQIKCSANFWVYCHDLWQYEKRNISELTKKTKKNTHTKTYYWSMVVPSLALGIKII